MKNCNETRDVVGDSRKRYRVRGQRWEDPDCINNQSESRIRNLPLREKYKYMLFTSGRSVLGETVPSVLSAVRGLPTLAVLKTEGTVILRNVSFTSTND